MTNNDEECGHTKNDGEPCTFDAKYPDGKCGHHTKHDTGADQREGRPSKLTKNRQEKIAEMIEQGHSIEAAARSNGVHPSNVYEWLNKGEEQDEGVYAEFRERFVRAKGIREQNYFDLIKELAREDGDHRFLMSLLKRRHPEAWSDTETGVDADTVKLEVSENVKNSWPDQ